MPIDSILASEPTTQQYVSRGVLRQIREDGRLMVEIENHGTGPVACDFLTTGSNSRLRLEPGDHVLIAPPASETGRWCVLGRIGTYCPPDDDLSDESTRTIRKKNIEIVADSKLVLRCGEGSLTVREDGTVIVKGSRILSRSKGVNKIKGASVQLN